MGRSISSGTNVLQNNVGTGNNSLVTVAARDTFVKGDPVFIDYDTGLAINLTQSNGTLAAAAGSAVYSVPLSYASGTVSGTSAAVTYADGSYAIVTNLTSSTTDTLQRISFYKYSVVGVLLQTFTIFPGNSGVPSDYSMCAVALPSGGLGATFRTQAGTSVYAILDANFNLLYGGTLSGSQLVITSIVATSDSGILAAGNLGVFRVSGAGVLTQPLSYTMNFDGEHMYTGSQTGLRNSSAFTANTGFTYDARGLFPISSSGWGIISNSGATAVRYDQFNADGSTRGTTTSLVSALTTVGKVISAVGASSNLFWAAQHSAGVTWGIVSDTGTTVKASALIASSDGTGTSSSDLMLRVVPDVNGEFFFTWSSGSGLTLNNNYVTGAAGTARGSFPRSDSVSAAGTNKLFRFSTGILHIFQGSAVSTTTRFSLWSNAAANVIDKLQIYASNLGSTSSVAVSAWTMVNDTIYGWQCSTPSVTRDTYGAFYRITNTGALSTVRSLTFNPTDVAPSMLGDANDIVVFFGSTVKRFKTSDLSEITLYTFTGQGYPASSTSNFKVIKTLKNYIVSYANIAVPYTAVSGNTMGWVVKPERTILLGVAAGNGTAGGTVPVQTKGHAATTWPASLAFDQSANSPAGQKGSTVGTFISLGGL